MNREQFEKRRKKLNEIVLKNANIDTKRFFSLDTKVYKDGALNSKTKEMLGLASSLVLRCEDCINYHIIQCYESGVNIEEFNEVFNIALIVGGSIIIPEIRKAYSFIEENNML